jgi:hypothetical protein
MSEINMVVLDITGGVHLTTPVSDEPGIRLTQWSIKECGFPDGTRARHLVGFDIVNHEGRVSSEIVEFDNVKMHVITSTGRVYALVGPAGRNKDADYVWDKWKQIYQVTNEVDVPIEELLQ